MKRIFSFLAAVIILAACGNNEQKTDETKKTSDTTAVAGDTTISTAGTANSDEIVASYLELKNALAADDSREAARAAKKLNNLIGDFGSASLTAEQKTVYEKVKAEAEEHSSHISDNGDNIKHQRSHFEMLTFDVLDLVRVVKPGQALYLDHCPMYNDKKGAVWLSETKEIKNPYYGKEMLTCGTIREEIKP